MRPSRREFAFGQRTFPGRLELTTAITTARVDWLRPKAPKPVAGGADGELIGMIEREMNSGVVSCRLVTSLRGPSLRRAYCVDLRDGRRIKVRQLWKTQRAGEIEQYLGLMQRRNFPAVLARSGAILLLEWIDGETLNCIPASADLYRRCGRLLARLHSTPVEPEPSAEGLLPRVAPRVRADVAALRDWRLLSPQEAAHLEQDLRQLLPRQAQPCLIHGDFCGENLVSGPNGEIFSIDNEALGIGYAESDLARALLRWSLSPEAQRALLAGYQEERELESFQQHCQFWQLVSLIRSVRFRYRCRDADYRPALTRLRQAIAV